MWDVLPVRALRRPLFLASSSHDRRGFSSWKGKDLTSVQKFQNRGISGSQNGLLSSKFFLKKTCICKHRGFPVEELTGRVGITTGVVPGSLTKARGLMLKSFCIPTVRECWKFFYSSRVCFPPLKLHLFSSKTIIRMCPPSPENFGQKAKIDHRAYSTDYKYY